MNFMNSAGQFFKDGWVFLYLPVALIFVVGVSIAIYGTYT